MSKADIEFYHSDLVLTLAKSFTPAPWEQLSYRSKQLYLNRAVDSLFVLHQMGVSLEKTRHVV